MKLPILLIATALAGGSALAQGTYSTPKATADTTAAPAQADKAPATVHKKKTSQKKTTKHSAHHASASKDTAAMGAGMASPVTDLNASTRQQRMDQAYADWQAKAR